MQSSECYSVVSGWSVSSSSSSCCCNVVVVVEQTMNAVQ